MLKELLGLGPVQGGKTVHYPDISPVLFEHLTGAFNVPVPLPRGYFKQPVQPGDSIVLIEAAHTKAPRRRVIYAKALSVTNHQVEIQTSPLSDYYDNVAEYLEAQK
jgi:hypothetical protein